MTSPFKPMSLLPSDRSSFYRYTGSLTAPSCEETVIWTIYESPVNISNYQVDLIVIIFIFINIRDSTSSHTGTDEDLSATIIIGTDHNKCEYTGLYRLRDPGLFIDPYVHTDIIIDT